MIVLGFDPPQGYALLDCAPRSRARYVGGGALPPLDGPAAVREIRAIHRSVGGARLVGVERVETVNARAGFGAAMARGLVLGHGVGQRVAQALLDDGLDVREMTAETWHEHAAGRRAIDAQTVAAYVRTQIVGWPARSNGHARDAACVALYAAHLAGWRPS